MQVRAVGFRPHISHVDNEPVWVNLTSAYAVATYYPLDAYEQSLTQVHRGSEINMFIYFLASIYIN